MTGLSFAARRAGSQHATAATTMKSVAIAANVAGSVGVTPTSMLLHHPRGGGGSGEPEHQADGAQAQPLPEDELEDAARVRAERHAHADLRRALPHRRRQHAVEPDRREHDRDHREHADEKQRELASAPSRDRQTPSSAAARVTMNSGSILRISSRTTAASASGSPLVRTAQRFAGAVAHVAVAEVDRLARQARQREVPLVRDDADDLVPHAVRR